ncbi:unnamed protein product [Peniophora sp. CBMAI 1063]|nr:unnamed protein product [Peniophora sp. CBMAI 1063]
MADDRPLQSRLGLTPHIVLERNGSFVSVPFGENNMDTILRRFHALKLRQNAHSSAYMLPPELLFLIFEDLAAIAPLQPKANDNLWNKIGFTVVAQISQRWRSAALAHKALWASIELGSMPARFLNMMVIRAGDHPLTVTCTSNRFPGPQLIPRARKLDMHGFDSVVSLLQKFSTLPALPLLETVRLVPTGRNVYNGPGFSSNFVEHTLPNLRSLEMKFIRFPWGAVAPHLRRLELVQTRVVRLDFILKGIAALLNLEVLILDDMDISAPPDDFRSIHCPQLRHFVIKGPPNECTIFWCSIETHPLAFVHIDASRACEAPVYPDTGDLADMAREAGDQFELYEERPAFSRLRMSMVKTKPKCQIEIDDEERPAGLYGDSETPSQRYPHPNAGLRVILPVPHRINETMFSDFADRGFDTMCRFLTAIPAASKWRVLEMQGAMGWDGNNLSSLLTHLSGIQSLRFDNCTEHLATAEFCR